MPVLGEKAMEGFVDALERGNEGEVTDPVTPEPAVEPQETPEGGASGQEPSAPVEGDGSPTPSAPAAPAAPAPAASATPPVTIEALQAKIKEYEDGAEARVREGTQKLLQQIALQSPENYKAIYAKEPPPGLFKAPGTPSAAPTKAQLDPKDPIHAELLENRKFREQIIADQEEARREEAKEALLADLTPTLDKFKVYKDPVIGNDAQAVLSSEINEAYAKNPKADLKAIVANVAKRYDTWAESLKKSYIDEKKGAARSVPAGAGKAGGAQPGQAPIKPKLGRGPGSIRSRLAQDLRTSRESQSE